MKKNDLTDLLKGIIFCFYIVALVVTFYGLIWARLDFTLTMFGWASLFIIFYSLWYDILDEFGTL